MFGAQALLFILYWWHTWATSTEQEIAENITGECMLQRKNSQSDKVSLLSSARVAENTSLRASAPSWLSDKKMTFMDFRVLCSHNTYTSGRQNDEVSHYNLLSALDLGYRCVELDVHLNKSADSPWTSRKNYCATKNSTTAVFPNVAGYMYVNHNGDTPLISSKNKVDLAVMLGGINEWLMKDEERDPASDEHPKLPLIISMDAYVGKRQWKLADIMECFWHDRLLTDQQLPKLGMASLISTHGKRKIILRATKASKQKLLKILALDKDKISKAYPNTKSFEAYRWTSAGLSYGNFQQKGIARVYPHKFNGNSENYDPYPALKDGVQLVCVNIQGYCPTWTDVVCHPFQNEYHTLVSEWDVNKCMEQEFNAFVKRGGDPAVSSFEAPYKCRKCTCNRQGAIQVEDFFHSKGYDGYMPKSVPVPESVKVYDDLNKA